LRLDTKIQLKDLEKFDEALTQNLMKNHEKLFSEKIRNIRRSVDEISSVSEKLDLAIKNAWGSLDKTTSEQGIRLTQTIKESARELAKQELDPNYKNSEKYHETAVEIQNRIILSIRRHVPKLHKVLKTDIATLYSTLSRLENSINNLGTALDGSPGRQLESLETEIKHLLEKAQAAKELESENQAIDEALRKITNDEKGLTDQQNLLHSREEFRQLQNCEDSLKTEKEKISQFLQPLAKPLRKFERTLPENTTIDRDLLTKLIETPSDTLLKTSPQTLESIFKALNNPLTEGKLGIEERKRKKALEVIETATNDELGKLQKSLHSIAQDAQTARNKLKTDGLFDTDEKLKEQLSKTQLEKEQLVTTRDSNQRKIEELGKFISKQKTMIETKIMKLSGQKVIIEE